MMKMMKMILITAFFFLGACDNEVKPAVSEESLASDESQYVDIPVTEKSVVKVDASVKFYDGGEFSYSYNEHRDEFIFHEKNNKGVKDGVFLKVTNATFKVGRHRQFDYKKYVDGVVVSEESSGEISIPKR